MSANSLTILGQAFYEAKTQAQEARDLAAVSAMLVAFGADDEAGPVSEPEALGEGAGGGDGKEPVETAQPVQEAPTAAVEAAALVPDVSPRQAKKARPKTAARENAALMPYLPAKPVLSPGSDELHPHLIAGALDGMAVNLMTRLCGDPVSLIDNRATFGSRERISIRTDADGKGKWRDSVANISGDHFHELLAHLLGVDHDRALSIALAISNGVDLDKAKAAILRKIGASQDTGFKSIWEAAVPLRQSLAMKPLRVAQGLDVRYSANDMDNLRGDSEGRLLALHRDPQSDAAVGLTIYSVRGEAMEAHGDVLAPVPLTKNWQDRSRIVIAPNMKTALFIATFDSPVVFVPRMFDRTTWPKFPTGKQYVIPLNTTITGEIGMLKARHGLHGRNDLSILLPSTSQEFPT